MNTDSHEILVGGVPVEVVRKRIKNLHLGVYPPEGRVRVAAPLVLSEEAVRLAVVARLGWIKQQRAKFVAQERQSAREYVSGKCHFFKGRRYRLSVIETGQRSKVSLRGSESIDLTIKPGADRATRESALQRWYRKELKACAAPLVEKWAQRAGLPVPDFRIKRMKTKWGTCSPTHRRIWLNLELIKKPPACLEYIVVHELIHLLERQHNGAFVAHMDRLLPGWRSIRQELNAQPLAHEEW
ncbi:MAG: SprT family zinc-dependent metalloprotease [Rhodomicrobium sp.]